MTTAAARRLAVTMPYHATLYAGWDDHRGTVVGFQSEDEARAFAASRPEPLIDLCRKGDGVIGIRRMVAHPLLPTDILQLRDDFPQDAR